MARRYLFAILTGVFVFVVAPKFGHAQNSCSLEEVFVACGAGTNFACISPTPTSVPRNPWIKVKSTSFSANSEASLQGFEVPTTSGLRLKFNESDTDDDNSGQFMIGDATGGIQRGIITAPQIGTGVESSLPSDQWVVQGYTRKKQIDPKKFLEYAKSRKDVNEIFQLNDQIQIGRVNVIKAGETPFIIDNSYENGVDNLLKAPPTSGTQAQKIQAQQQKPHILVIEGDLTIQRDINYSKTDPTYIPYPLTIVVTGTTTIQSPDAYPNSVNQINAILITNDLIIGPTVGDDEYGLKIKGNLIVSGEMANQRSRTDARRPVMFIVQDPAMYISLLPYFSTSEYEWKQIQ